MSGGAPAEPIGDEEADRLLSPLDGSPVALAVSGGPDSMALMLLVARRLARRQRDAQAARRPVLVVTVDHGLRPASTDEARLVVVEAARLDLPHQTLAWTGPKPATGLAEAAREARYRLIARAVADEAGSGPRRALVTAHHADDQLETFLMRLARGSGVQGLGAMRSRAELDLGEAGTLVVLRPLLPVPKARLIATVAAAGLPFVSDPTNTDQRYERPRLRAAAAALEAAGVSPAAVGASARRIARADAALSKAAHDAISRLVTRSDNRAVASMPAEGLAGLADEISIRVLAILIAAVVPDRGAPRLSEIERLDGRLRSAIGTGQRWRATLGEASILLRERAPQGLVIELSRAPPRRSH